MHLQSVVLQYVDDLLLCVESKEQCINDSLKLLERLAKGTHKVSRKKLQFCSQELEYLGRLISAESKRMSNKQLETIMQVPQPETVGQMMTFLGMAGFSMDWVEGYSEKTQPLRKLMKEVGQERLANKLHWNVYAEIAFENIKKELMQAPALALPDYKKSFDLYVATRAGYMTAVLMQNTQAGKRKQALAYYSTKLDEVATGFPPCYQDLAGIWEAYQKAVSVTIGYPIKIYTHHKVVEMLDEAKFMLIPARIHNYQMCIQTLVVKCDTVNPAGYVPLPFDGTPHKCVPESKSFMKLCEDLMADPLQQEDKRILLLMDPAI